MSNVAGPAAKKMEGLRELERAFKQLADDRDVRATQLGQKLVVALQQLTEVLVHGEVKTKAGPRHHE